jgi:hypothetical protein
MIVLCIVRPAVLPEQVEVPEHKPRQDDYGHTGAAVKPHPPNRQNGAFQRPLY